MNKLSFKHHEVAARLTDSPEAAVAALSMAHYCRWSANRLEQSLASARPKPKPPVMLSTFFRWLSATIGGWPADTRKHVPAMLRRLCRHVEWSLSPDGDCCPPGIRDLVDAEDDADLPAWVRDLGVPDDTDAIGGHDVEAA